MQQLSALYDFYRRRFSNGFAVSQVDFYDAVQLTNPFLIMAMQFSCLAHTPNLYAL